MKRKRWRMAWTEHLRYWDEVPGRDAAMADRFRGYEAALRDADGRAQLSEDHQGAQVLRVWESVTQIGFVNPLLIWMPPYGSGSFVVIGQQRLAVARANRYAAVPVVDIHADTEQEAVQTALAYSRQHDREVPAW